MTPYLASASWFQTTLGGWPNLMQGLVSAVIGGIVAAATAFLVVHLTHGRNLRLAAEIEARSATRALMTATAALGTDLMDFTDPTNVSDWSPKRWESGMFRMLLSYTSVTGANLPSIAAVDPVFHKKLLGFTNGIATAVQARGDMATLATAMQDSEQFARDVKGLLDEATSWLARRT